MYSEINGQPDRWKKRTSRCFLGLHIYMHSPFKAENFTLPSLLAALLPTFMEHLPLLTSQVVLYMRTRMTREDRQNRTHHLWQAFMPPTEPTTGQDLI